MITGNIQQLSGGTHRDILPASVVEAMQTLNGKAPVGERELEGQEVVLKVVEMTTHPKEAGTFEAHRRHIDVHYILQGKECVQYEQVDRLRSMSPYNPTEDFCLYAGGKNSPAVSFQEGDFYILYPSDAHNPGCCVEQPASLKKAIFKVAISETAAI